MTNLKKQEKRLIFKILFYIGVFLVFAAWLTIMFKIIEDTDTKYKIDRLETINVYENKLHQKDSIYNTLKSQYYISQIKIDSLENVKNKIIIKYDKEIKGILNAGASEHGMWMDTILTKMNNIKR